MAVSFMLLLFAARYGQFVLAMVVLTLGESLLIPGVPAYVNRLSPVVQKGRGQGMVNAFSSLGKALGPLFGGLVIERLGYLVRVQRHLQEGLIFLQSYCLLGLAFI